MEPQTKCESTTENSIQNTSQPPNEQQGSETPINKEPIDLEHQTEHDEGKSSQYFSLLDLDRLTFSLDGIEVLNAQDATNEQFAALADVVANVSNVEQWYIEERRDFINGLQVFCEEHGEMFPFTLVDEDPEEKTPTAPLSTEEEQENG